MNISVNIGSAVFPNPVTVASGTFGHSEDLYDLEEVRKLGAILPKTVTRYPQEGNPPPRICETPAGMINAPAREPSILRLAWMTESSASRSTTTMEAASPISG